MKKAEPITPPHAQETPAVPPARYLTIEQLAATTTLSVSTLRRLCKRGILVGLQPGGPRTRIVFAPDAIEQAVKAALPADNVPARPRKTGALPGPRPRWQAPS
jgi:hypothetical protein